MKKVWVSGIVIVLMTMFLSFGTAHALAITSVLGSDVDGLFGAATYSFSDTFDFDPFTGPDGTIYSWVRPGIDAATLGNYLYLYQIVVNTAPPSSDVASGITIPFLGLITSVNVGGSAAADESMYISDSTGIKTPSLADFSFGELTFIFLPKIGYGESSKVFGVISSLPPAIVPSGVLDNGSLDTANVFAPGSVTEPTTLLLLGSGLIGVGILGRKRFKKR